MVVSLSSMSTVSARPELTRSAFEVLLALQAGAAHGYAVMRFVEQTTDGAATIPAGTLYRTLARLVADGLVEETGTADPDAPHDARRRYYRLTVLGRGLAAEEARLMARLLSAAADAGLLAEGDAR
jgi:DNA-binding PadR family transcriptional regulator